MDETPRLVARCGRRRTPLLAAATALAALCTPGSPALADDSAVPDPLAAGPYPVHKVEYDAGTLLLTLPDSIGGTVSVPMRGSITYPDGADQSKIVVFVHGRHGVCIGTPSSNPYICGDETSSDGTPIETDIRSYEGYDYMARNLASHGYAVMSVEANVTNFDNGYTDAGANARSQIIYQSLQLLFRWNNGSGPVVPGDPDHTVGTKLVGKLDFSDGLGLMGHSRGGDAVTDFVTYNRNLPSGSRRFLLAGVLALAPTYYTLNKTPEGANYATLLPACDGDVSTLHGGRFFENAKYAAGNATTAKVQWYVQGADHNFFNTVWTDDDFSNRTDPACTRGLPTSARLDPADQRRVGAALMESFLRRYVGGETAFDPIMTGAVALPPQGAPQGSGVSRGEEVKTSYVGPSAARLDVLRPEPTQDPATNPPAPVNPNALTIDAAGGAISTSGFEQYLVCDPAAPPVRGAPLAPTAYPLCPLDTVTNPASPTAVNRSIGTQFQLGWSGPATLTAMLGPFGTIKDVSGYGVLELRAAVNRSDPRNPQGDGATPQAATQDFDVTVIDAAGGRATTNAARWTTSLEPSIGATFRHVVLNGIRIPLSAFAGVDLTHVTAVELGFGARTASGSIQLADVAFQESAPAGGWTADAVNPVIPRADGPASPLPGPVIGTPAQLGGASRTCRDTTLPASRVTTVILRRDAVRIAGRASDKTNCAKAAGGVRRTLVQVALKVKGGVRFMGARGRLGKRSVASQPLGVLAKGTTSWSLMIRRTKLPAGAYVVRVITFDQTGNARRLAPRTVRVR